MTVFSYGSEVFPGHLAYKRSNPRADSGAPSSNSPQRPLAWQSASRVGRLGGRDRVDQTAKRHGGPLGAIGQIAPQFFQPAVKHENVEEQIPLCFVGRKKGRLSGRGVIAPQQG